MHEFHKSKLCSNWQSFYDNIIEDFSSKKPNFLSRFGGSDTTALIDFLAVQHGGPDALNMHISEHLPIVERYNGFYDLGSDKEGTYLKYLATLLQCYTRMESATFVHSHILSLFFREEINSAFVTDEIPNKQVIQDFVSTILKQDSFNKAYPYNFIEGLVKNPFTLFRTFEKILKDRTVLVISPFSESIQRNFPNRSRFFCADFTYPDFDLQLINTPITYSGMPAHRYPHRNWFDTVEQLKEQLKHKDFDIALLSCGSYAMPLGDFIRHDLKKKAIYVGGVLQLFFGIMGRRYQNSFFLDQINAEQYIEPIEKQVYLDMMPKADHVAREAFGAYF